MKAILGATEPRPHRLIAELTALRTRVVELERELARTRAENAALREARDSDVAVVSGDVALTNH